MGQSVSIPGWNAWDRLGCAFEAAGRPDRWRFDGTPYDVGSLVLLTDMGLIASAQPPGTYELTDLGRVVIFGPGAG